MKVKTSELTGAALDWAVAKCEGFNPVFTRHYVTPSHVEDPKKVCIPASSWVQPFEPSTNWAQGGPILVREEIGVQVEYTDGEATGWVADSMRYCRDEDDQSLQFGPTPLIAAMRCFIASKMGEGVEVPDELIKDNQP